MSHAGRGEAACHGPLVPNRQDGGQEALAAVGIALRGGSWRRHLTGQPLPDADEGEAQRLPSGSIGGVHVTHRLCRQLMAAVGADRERLLTHHLEHRLLPPPGGHPASLWFQSETLYLKTSGSVPRRSFDVKRLDMESM